MTLPFFYKENIIENAASVVLDEETSKHVVQVLRMQKADHLQLTDGKGNLFLAEIIGDHKKKCELKILSNIFEEPPIKKISIGISLIKNTSRFEWFLEKATEIGVNEIIPLICDRTEKQQFRFERMKGILVSAMLQSQQACLPLLSEPVKFGKFISSTYSGEKFIAYCENEYNKEALVNKLRNPAEGSTHQLMLIGPEGDFTKTEIELAVQNNFTTVALGETRLRTETAGIVAATLMLHV